MIAKSQRIEPLSVFRKGVLHQSEGKFLPLLTDKSFYAKALADD